MRKAASQPHLSTGSNKPKSFQNRRFAFDHPTHAGQRIVPHLFNPASGTSTAAKEYPVRNGLGYLVDMQNEPGPARILLSPSTKLNMVGHHFQAVISHNPNAVGAGENDYLANHVRAEEHREDTGDTFIS